jgi:hypothetical protein
VRCRSSASFVAASIAVAILMAACGSSGSKSATSSPITSASAPSTASSSAAASGTPADPVTKAAVTRAYTKFFNFRTPVAENVARLQHGDALKSAVLADAKVGRTQQITSSVASVTVMSSDVAKVVWTLNTAGNPVLPNTSGYAVREDGVWKVAAQTFCALAAMGGLKAAACNDPSVTALPS